jgi:transcriptional regulator with XRE-family HTH domain
MTAQRGTAGSGRHHQARPGLVAGTVLRAARLSADVTRNALAAAAGVNRNMFRSWENGSCPLASVPAPDLHRLETVLAEHGADQLLVADLSAAIWCDLLLIAAMDQSEDVSCLLADPITGERAFRELLSWSPHRADTSQVPARLRVLAPDCQSDRD